jgi:hypothetical protein
LAGRVFHQVILKHVSDLGRHDVAHLALIGRLALSDCPHRDVAIGEHPDEPVVLADG